jgi:hypothetical protein
VDKVVHLALRWRYLVVAVEVLLAGGCLWFGWQVVAPGAAAPIRVHHSASAPGDGLGALALPAVGAPSAPTASGHATAAHPPPAYRRSFEAPNLTADWLSHMNADDYDLYRGQWQTLQLLMSGVRQYLEQRVVPRLLGH